MPRKNMSRNQQRAMFARLNAIQRQRAATFLTNDNRAIVRTIARTDNKKFIKELRTDKKFNDSVIKKLQDNKPLTNAELRRVRKLADEQGKVNITGLDVIVTGGIAAPFAFEERALKSRPRKVARDTRKVLEKRETQRFVKTK